MKKTFVGLGNIGDRYRNTRHNVGFMFVDRFVSELGGRSDELKHNKKIKSKILEIDDYIFVKPQTMMNNSGSAVSSYLNYYKPDESHRLYIVHDDLDIALGGYKIVSGKGPKVHNGVTSVEEALGKKDFDRIRVGVEARGEEKISGEEYVLQKFSEIELEVVDGVITKIIKEFSK